MNNNTTTKKAIIASVDLGFTEIEGLMLSNGTYRIGVSQICKILPNSVPPKNVSRTLKRNLGEDFPFHRCTSELNSKPVNTVTLEQVVEVIEWAAFEKGDKDARALAKALMHEPLERRFDSAFRNKVEDAEYTARLRRRYERLKARHQWTDILRDRALAIWGRKPTPEEYKEWTVTVNIGLFNKPHFYCDRNNMDELEQQTITNFEFMAQRRANQYPTASPNQLVELALDTF